MIINEPFHLVFKRTYQQVLFLSTALNDTFVMAASISPNQDALLHLDSNGKIISQHVFEGMVESFAMASQREVVIANPKQYQLLVWQLWGKHKLRTVHHDFMSQQVDQCIVDAFSESNLICVRQWGRYNQHKLHLSYYHHPLKPSSKKVASYESKQMEWTYQMAIKKVNQHSMYVWYRRRCDEEIDLKVYDLREDKRGRLVEMRVKNTIGQIYNLPITNCTILDVFQFKPTQLMLSCASNKLSRSALNKKKAANDNYILDLKYRSIRQASFCFPPLENQRIAHLHSLRSFSVFRTYGVDPDTQRMALSPVYFVDNRRQRIFAKEQWVCGYRWKFFVPEWSENVLLECQYENGQVGEVGVVVKRMWERRTVYLQMLLHLNQEFEEDLLADAIQLLDRT